MPMEENLFRSTFTVAEAKYKAKGEQGQTLKDMHTYGHEHMHAQRGEQGTR